MAVDIFSASTLVEAEKKETNVCSLIVRLPKAHCVSFFLHQHFQTMLKTKLNVLTLKKEPLPTVIFHEPEAIELCSTTPLTKSRTQAGYKVGSHEPNNP